MKRIIGITILLLSISCGKELTKTITPQPTETTIITTSTSTERITLSPTRTDIYSTPIRPEIKGLTLVDGICDEHNCLFQQEEPPYQIYGIASMVGYYSAIEKSGWGETKDCDSFTLTGGKHAVIEWILYLIFDLHNGLNTINEKGQPVINIELSNLSENDKQLILNSNELQRISLTLLVKRVGPHSGPVCESIYSISKVYSYDIYHNQ